MKWFKVAFVPALIAALVLVQPSAADAGRWGRHHGGGGHGGFGPGLFVGAVFGLMAGAAISNSQNNNYYNSGYYGSGYRGSCRRVVRVCRNHYGPYGSYTRCYRRVRWVC